MPGMYFEKKQDGGIECRLCPHACVIAPGRHGRCRVRFNRDGELDLPYYGRVSSLAVDPIEKKPLYHYFPGAAILSVGFWGCSFRCPFCQNFTISQSTSDDGKAPAPRDLVDMAVDRGSMGIAYTYSEPLIHFEYVLDTSRIARERGLKNVLVTNGYIQRGPADELLSVTDAANVDLKSFNADFYREEIGGGLAPVKRFLSQAAGRIHLEVTTLVIPQRNDSEREIEDIALFLADLSPDIPYHLSCYYPTYKYTIPPTSPESVARLADVARRHLRYVYLGNAGSQPARTTCPDCGNVLISRSGYRTRIEGVEAGRCSRCGRQVSIAVTE